MVLHSNTYYAVPTASCSDAVTKKGAKFDSPYLAHRHSKRRPQATPDLTLLYTLSQRYGHLVGESTIIVNEGYYPAKRVCMTVVRGLSQISYD